jgi:hypothetical protein
VSTEFSNQRLAFRAALIVLQFGAGAVGADDLQVLSLPIAAQEMIQ